jgi:hypothetical protein
MNSSYWGASMLDMDANYNIQSALNHNYHTIVPHHDHDIAYAPTIPVAVLLKCIDPSTHERYSRTCHFGVLSTPLCFRRRWYRSMAKSQDNAIVNLLLAYQLE